MWFTVVTTYRDGELRYYEVFEEDMQKALALAKEIDAKDYPSKPSDWGHFSVLHGSNHAIWHE